MGEGKTVERTSPEGLGWKKWEEEEEEEEEGEGTSEGGCTKGGFPKTKGCREGLWGVGGVESGGVMNPEGKGEGS